MHAPLDGDRASSRAGRTDSRRHVAVLLCWLLAVVSGLTLAAPATARAGTSTNGSFTLTKTASTATVPAGGGNVTYTYTVKNNTAGNLYYVSGNDDKCAPLQSTAGLTSAYDALVVKIFQYVPANGTATWTCTQTVTQAIQNTASFTFATGYSRGLFSYAWTGQETATDQATVTVSTPTNLSAGTCSQLWYSSDENDATGSFMSDGTIGNINMSTGAVTPVMSIGKQTGADSATSSSQAGYHMVGSAAVAIDPSNPNLIYYIPRYSLSINSPGGALWVYDQSTNTSHIVSDTNPTATSSNLVVRLGVDPNGNLWSISDSGTLYELNPKAATPTWTAMGSVSLSNSLSFANLQSGDLAFDGNGTMYFIASDSGGSSYLYTITAAQLAAATSTGSTTAQLVGGKAMSAPSGGGFFNGFAFGPDGTAYATTTNGLYSVDITTATTKLVGTTHGTNGTGTNTAYVSDLTSCALPKPQLQVTKTVNPNTAVAAGGTVSYTVVIKNLGTLAATNTTFQDQPTGSTVTSETLNGGSNLGATYYNTAQLVNSPNVNPGIIAPGASATIVITTTVPTGTTATQACNQASVKLTGVTNAILSDDPNLAGATDKTCVTIKNPAIAVDKTGSTTTLNSDGSPTAVTYTYKVTNTGTEPLKNVSVADDKCSPVTYQSGDTNGDGILTGDETWVYTCSQTLTQATTNTATASGTGASTGTPVTGTDTWTVNAPGLTFTKSVSPTGTVNPGDTLTYTLTVKNTGTVNQTNVVVTDPLPTGETYVAGSSTMSYPTTTAAQTGLTKTYTNTTPVNIDSTTPVNQAITIPAADFPSGSTMTGYSVVMNGQANAVNPATYTDCGGKRDVGVTATFSGAYTLAKTQWVTPGTTSTTGDFSQDPTNANTSCSGAWKTVTRSATGLNAPLTSNVVLTLGWYDQWPDANITPDNQATSVAVTVTYSTPASTSTTTKPAHDAPNLVTSADAVTLAPGATLTVTFKATVDANAPSTLKNTATTQSDQTPPETSTVTNTVNQPRLNLTKTVGAVTGPTAGGDWTVTYTLQMANTGTASGSYGPILDTPSFAPNLAISSVDWQKQGAGSWTATTADANGAYPVGTANTAIATGATDTYTVRITYHWTTATATAADTCAATPAAGQGLYNSASAAAETGSTADNSACASVTPPTQGLTMTKSVKTIVDTNKDGFNDAGDVITYTFSVKNTGTTTLTNVTINDALLGLTAMPCVASLAPGATATCDATVGYTITAADVNAGSVTNTATATGTPPYTPPITTPPSTVVTPTATTGQVTVTKTDAATGKTLQGAVFSLYTTTASTWNGTTMAPPATACQSAATGTPARTGLVTGTNGTLTINGLALSDYDYANYRQVTSGSYTVYCLVETTAPSGYELAAAPVTFTVQASTGTASVTVKDVVHNLANALPLTGGHGVGVAAAGLALLAAAGLLVLRRRTAGGRA